VFTRFTHANILKLIFATIFFDGKITVRAFFGVFKKNTAKNVDN
jgi:hypothetical protein